MLISKSMIKYLTSTDSLKHIHKLQLARNKKDKARILELKGKVNDLEDELASKKKVLYVDYEDAKTDIKQFLADFMVDDYKPGLKIRESIDKSCNMVINYSRISNVEDPIDMIKKEMATGKETGAMDFFRQGIMAIGQSFAQPEAPSRSVLDPLSNSKPKPAKAEKTDPPIEKKVAPPLEKKVTPPLVEKKAIQAPAKSSGGIFDTLFNPISYPSKKPDPVVEEKPESPKKSLFGITKDNTVSLLFYKLNHRALLRIQITTLRLEMTFSIRT